MTSPRQDPLKLGPKIDALRADSRNDESLPGFGDLKRLSEQLTQLRADRNDTHRVMATVVLGFACQDGQPPRLPVDVAPAKVNHFRWSPQSSPSGQPDHQSPIR
jgi:hypothetical protein